MYVYGTVYNNANRIVKSINSIAPLKPYKIFVTDNYSFDGSYELLKRIKNVSVTQAKCKRGEGRNIALERLLKEAKPSDALICIDFDVIYKSKYINYIKSRLKNLKDKEVHVDMGSLSTIKTNKDLKWPNLNAYEDVVRMANAASMGFRIYRLIPKGKDFWKGYWDNESTSGSRREGRYERNVLGKYKRYFVHIVDAERGGGMSFKDFYAISESKGAFYYIGYLLAFITAHVLGTYRVDKNLDNERYVNAHTIFISK